MENTATIRKIYDSLATGWNTWDVRSVTAHVLLPQGLEVNLTFVLPRITAHVRDLAWGSVRRFGEHSVSGDFTDITLNIYDRDVRVRSAAQNDELLLLIEPLTPCSGLWVSVEVSSVWGKDVRIERDTGRILARVAGDVPKKNDGSSLASVREFIIDGLQAEHQPAWDPSRAPHLNYRLDTPVRVRVNSGRDTEEIDARIEEAERTWRASAIDADGDLGEGLAAMRRVLLWNTIYESRGRRVITPVSRNWCTSHSPLGDYVLFCWDTFFAALMLGLIDKRLAYANFFAMLEEATPEGMIPNTGAGSGKSASRSEPQVGAWCAWKLYLQHRERWFVEAIFEPLLAWNRWRERARDYRKNGLIGLGSDPFDNDNPDDRWKNTQAGTRQAAMFESGLDNSPMWDNLVFNEEKHCLEVEYVGGSALLAADCECLEKMARLLGREDEEKELRQRRRRIAAAINESLWHEPSGTYLNRDWQNQFSSRLSPTHLYPLLAGIVPEQRVRTMIREHLLNHERFLGEYMIPMISRDDPAFAEQNYWRGRIWAPTNFLVCEGLRRAGETEAVEIIVRQGLKLFLQNWRENGTVGENYNAMTGEAAEGNTVSDRFYHWGALMVYLAVQQQFDCQVWDDTVRNDPPPDGLSPLRNLPIEITVMENLNRGDLDNED